MRIPFAGLLILAGCASSLPEPKTLSVAHTGREASALLAEASACFAQRPDREAVEKARTLYLEAAGESGPREGRPSSAPSSGEAKPGSADPVAAEALLGAVEASAWLVEHSLDAHQREALSTAAAEAGALCLQRAPESASCHYALAIGLGVQARERPSTGLDALPRILHALERAEAGDPALDHAGPERVLAIVYVRAPGWPIGPGDPEAGIEQATRALERAPDYPPNALALAEALVVAERFEDARPALARAQALVEASAQARHPDAKDWRDQVAALEARLR